MRILVLTATGGPLNAVLLSDIHYPLNVIVGVLIVPSQMAHAPVFFEGEEKIGDEA
jgi:hypothetical protein